MERKNTKETICCYVCGRRSRFVPRHHENRWLCSDQCFNRLIRTKTNKLVAEANDRIMECEKRRVAQIDQFEAEWHRRSAGLTKFAELTREHGEELEVENNELREQIKLLREKIELIEEKQDTAEIVDQVFGDLQMRICKYYGDGDPSKLLRWMNLAVNTINSTTSDQ